MLRTKTKENDMRTGAPEKKEQTRYDNRCSGKKAETNYMRTDASRNNRKELYENRCFVKTLKTLHENRCSGKKKPRQNDMKTDAPKKTQKQPM